MLKKLTESAEAASSKTLDAFAQVIRALAPEVCSVSFHDFAAETLLLSDDYLLPEDHQLVEECLSSDAQGGTRSMTTALARARAIRWRSRCATHATKSTVRCGSASIRKSSIREPPSLWRQRLAPVLVCLAAEFERRGAVPVLPQR